jgi:hypothetical protein
MENLVGLGKKMRCGSPCALVAEVPRFALHLRNFPCQLLGGKGRLGAGLQFLVFGLLHAFYLTANRAARVFKYGVPLPLTPLAKWITHATKVAVKFVAVMLAFVFFRSACR